MVEDLEMFQKPIPVGYNVYLEGEDEYYTIENREPFNIDKTYAEVNSGATLGNTEETVIQPSDGVIYQMWIGIKHDIKLSLWQPSSTKSLGTDADPDGYINKDMSPYYDPNRDYTIFMPPEEDINLDIENISDVSFAPKLRYTGFKYEVKELTSKPETFIKLPTESFGG